VQIVDAIAKGLDVSQLKEERGPLEFLDLLSRLGLELRRELRARVG